MVAGGALTFSAGQVYRGDVVYATTAALTQVNVPNGMVYRDGPIDFTAAGTYLTGRADAWAAIPATGTTTYTPTGPTWDIALAGSDPDFNVFTIDGAMLSAASGLTITAPAGSTVLINVIGATVSLSGFQMTLSGVDRQHVLFNFVTATTLSIGAMSVQGTVLAPRADVSFTNAHIDGQLVAKSATGDGQLHLVPFLSDCPALASPAFTVTVTAAAPFVGPKFFVVGPGESARYSSAGGFLGANALGTTVGTPVGVAANAAGTWTWVAEVNPDGTTTVRTYDPDGSVRGAWRAYGVTDARDVATDGTDIWIVGEEVGTGVLKVFRYANGAKLLRGGLDPVSSFALTAANANPTGLATNGWDLFVVDADGTGGRIWAYDANGNPLGGSNGWQLDAANTDPSGVTLNPSGGNDLWVVDRTAKQVFTYANGRSAHWWNPGGPQAAASVFALAAGSPAPEGIADPLPGGQTASWIGGSTGVWDDPANWDTDAVPTAADDVVIPTGVTVTVPSSTYAEVYALSGDGSVVIDGGTLRLGAASSIVNLTVSSGTLDVPTSLTVSGTFTWNGGYLYGPGTVTVTGHTALPSGGNRYLSSNGALVVAGTGTWSGGTIDAGSDGRLEIAAAGNLTITGSAGLTGSGDRLGNAGMMIVATGTLTLTAVGTSTGTLDVAAGGTLRFDGGDGTFAAAGVSGAGAVEVAGGALMVSGAYGVSGSTSVSSGTLTLDGTSTLGALNLSGGFLAGSGTATVTDTLNWSSGEMSGPGTTVVAAGGTLTVAGSSPRTLTYGRTLRNEGTGTWSGAYIEVSTGGGSVVNAGTLTVSGGSFGGGMEYGAGGLSNGGTLIVSGSGFGINSPLSNTGTINVSNGTLTVSGGGSSTGSIAVSAGAGIRFENSNSSDLFLLGGATTGMGTVEVTSGEVAFGANYALAGTTVIAGGVARFDGTTTLNSLAVTSGELTGSGTVTVGGILTWTGGQMAGAGSTVVGVGGTVTLDIVSDTRSLSDGRSLVVAGTGTWSGGTIDADWDGRLVVAVGGSLTVTGSVSLTGSGGDSLIVAGTLSVATGGTFTVSTAGSSSGTVTAAAGGTLRFDNMMSSTPFTLGGTTSGLGRVEVVSGEVAFGSGYALSGLTELSGGTAWFNGTTSLGTLLMNGGTLDGSGAVTATGSLTWNSGEMRGSGTTVIAPGGTLSLTGSGTRSLVDGRTLRNEGTATWTGVHIEVSTGGGSVVNAGTLTVSGGSLGGMESGAGGLSNSGTLIVSGSGFGINSPLSNTGTINVSNGTLTVSGGGSSLGSLTVAAGSMVRFEMGSASAPFTLGGTASGTGTLEVSTDITVDGDYSVGTTIVSSGALTVDGSATTGTLRLTGGTVGGTGTITAVTLLDWISGEMTGPGVTAIGPDAVLAASGASTRYLRNGRTLRNHADTLWPTGSGITLSGGSVVENAAGGTLTLQGSDWLGSEWGYPDDGALRNAGTLVKSGTGTFTAAVPVENLAGGELRIDGGTLTAVFGLTTAGTVVVSSGTALITGDVGHSYGVTVTNGSVQLAGGTLATTWDEFTGSQFVTLTGGELTGFGTIDAPVANSGGTVRPGSGGTLTVTGNYNQEAGGTLATAIGGSGSGPLAVAGTVDLAGTLAVSEAAGFATAAGFPVLTVGGATDPAVGTFAGLPDGTEVTLGGKPYLLRYAAGDGNDVVLVYDGPAVSVGDVRILEGNAGVTPFAFPVTLSRPWPVAVTVQYATEDLTATAGADYVAASGVVTFAPFQTEATVVVPVLGDLEQEPSERFRVVLSDPTEAVLGDAVGIGTIANDDGVLSIPDNKGTEFWLTFPGNSTGPNLGGQRLILFLTGDEATEGTVSIPGLGYSVPFSVSPGIVTSVTLPEAAELLGASDAIQSNGILVAADAEIAVYGLNQVQYSTDAFLGLPVDVLGTEYLIMSYANIPEPWILRGTEFAIVAVEDGTVVTITPTVTTGSRIAGKSYTIELDRGQTYQLMNETEYQEGDLTGTFITSNLPVAVFGAHQAANIPTTAVAADHIVEQLPPVSTWGKEFATVPLATRTGDTFRILASEDGTVVQVGGQVVGTLDRGEFYEAIFTSPTTILANQPILVAQYSNSSSYDLVTSDPFMMLVTPLEQFQAEYTVSTPADGIESNFINLTVPSEYVGLVALDGVHLSPSGFFLIPGSGYSGLQVPIELGSHTLSAPIPFGVSVYGFDDYDSYGYPGGLALAPVALASAIGLSPSLSEVQVGTMHTVTATVTDSTGKRLAGIRVDFIVVGANSATGFSLTDANGQATFTYTGTVRGADTITASVGTLAANAEADWLLVPPTIIVDDPADGTSFPAGQTVLVTGRATAGQLSAPIASVTMDGVPVDGIDPTGRFFALVPVGPGQRTLRFVATDVYGQSAETTLTLTGTQAPAGRIDFSQLVEVGHVDADYFRTSFDEDTNTIYADVTVRNAGTYAVGGPVLVGVRNLSDPTVRLAAPAGYAPDGTAYLDLTGLVGPDGVLSPGEATALFALAFVNPNRVRFSYDLVLLGTPNRAPAFAAAPTLTARPGAEYRYAAAAVDPDGHALTFALAGGPAGMTIDAETGLVTWTPAAGDVGGHGVIVQVEDGYGGSVVQRFSLTVEPSPGNRPPAFRSVPPVAGAVHTEYGYTPYVIDPDGDAVTFTLTDAPIEMTADPATGVLTWMPTADQVGDHTVTLTADDGAGGTVAQTFTVRVTPEPGNHDPVFVSTPGTSVLANQPYIYQARAADPDGDTLTYTLVGDVPAGLTMTPDGRIEWTPTTVGTGTFTVQATDGRGGAAEQTVVVAIGSDAPATIAGEVFEDTNADGVRDPGEAALDGWTVYLDANGNQRRDGDELQAEVQADGTYAFAGLPAGTYALAAVRPDGWVFTLPAGGRQTVTVTAGEAGTGSFGAIPRIVPAVNHDPVFGDPPTTPAAVGSAYTTVTMAVDPDGDPVTYDLPVGPAGMAVDTFTGRLVWSPGTDQVGGHDVIVRARDGRGGVALLSFRVVVEPVDTPPLITSDPTGPAVAGRAWTYPVAAQDADGDALTFTLVDGPGGMTIDATSGVVSWTPSVGDVGDHPVVVRVSDGRGGALEQSFTLPVIVLVTNDPPAIASEPTGPAAVGFAYRYVVEASDPSGDVLTFSLDTAPAGMTIDPVTGVLTWTPGTNQAGEHAVVVRVSDGRGGAATQAFTLPAVPANGFPTSLPSRRGQPWRAGPTGTRLRPPIPTAIH